MRLSDREPHGLPDGFRLPAEEDFQPRLKAGCLHALGEGVNLRRLCVADEAVPAKNPDAVVVEALHAKLREALVQGMDKRGSVLLLKTAAQQHLAARVIVEETAVEQNRRGVHGKIPEKAARGADGAARRECKVASLFSKAAQRGKVPLGNEASLRHESAVDVARNQDVSQVHGSESPPIPALRRSFSRKAVKYGGSSLSNSSQRPSRGCVKPICFA